MGVYTHFMGMRFRIPVKYATNEMRIKEKVELILQLIDREE